MTVAQRLEALHTAGLVHPRPEAVTAAVFDDPGGFFLPADKVQVKYEMLRAHLVDGAAAAAAARSHGYSRASFYVVAAAFDERGMAGLFDQPRGRKGPVKLTPEIVAWLRAADASLSGATLADQVFERFGVRLHRRTIERLR